MINKELFKKMGVETTCLKFAFGKKLHFGKYNK